MKGRQCLRSQNPRFAQSPLGPFLIGSRLRVKACAFGVGPRESSGIALRKDWDFVQFLPGLGLAPRPRLPYPRLCLLSVACRGMRCLTPSRSVVALCRFVAPGNPSGHPPLLAPSVSLSLAVAKQRPAFLGIVPLVPALLTLLLRSLPRACARGRLLFCPRAVV